MMNNYKQDNFYCYEYTYRYLLEFLEGFNDKYDYNFYIEPFLEISTSCIGIFSKKGLFVFFKFKSDLTKNVIEESSFVHKINIYVNPYNLPTEKELEFLLLKLSTNFDSIKEYIKKCQQKT